MHRACLGHLRPLSACRRSVVRRWQLPSLVSALDATARPRWCSGPAPARAARHRARCHPVSVAQWPQFVGVWRRQRLAADRAGQCGQSVGLPPG
eukprot:3799705-Alexandrium_andersonii.AAC.1